MPNLEICLKLRRNKTFCPIDFEQKCDSVVEKYCLKALSQQGLTARVRFTLRPAG